MNKKIIEDLLDGLNISVNNLGYKYWITAVEIKMKYQEETMGNLCIDIAKKHESTPSCVERALRYAHTENRDRIKNYFKIDYKITNTRLLALLVREIERIKIKNKN